ncbi:hypothetical protein BDZ94DRAFT_1278529 [Collybia nuda]|uniref:CBM1 domain-containing protein n=1 Tax=Collybia nuda TaxID=64659 RepID=A0A9P5XQS3_9AGAR|nr:hypothetical protein BDZ94DRAFT_1278529 [Collybia nuda]
MWGQCGGYSYPGPFNCEPGGHCQSLGPYYSQCQPDDPSTMTYPDPTTITICA